jgi:hypothetical protein
MSAFSHVIEYDGGVLELRIGPGSDKTEFFNPMERFNGDDQWALTLSPTDAEETEFLQAAGSDPHTIIMDIRKPGGQQWGLDFVRYAIGHPHDGVEPLDTPVTLPGGVHNVGRSEIFAADEAADLFYAYYTTGDIPSSYSLRPVDGYTADGGIYDLRDGAPRKVR